jgi:hypothetical protein
MNFQNQTHLVFGENEKKKKLAKKERQRRTKKETNTISKKCLETPRTYQRQQKEWV